LKSWQRASVGVANDPDEVRVWRWKLPRRS
jgi:hypothetical protein